MLLSDEVGGVRKPMLNKSRNLVKNPNSKADINDDNRHLAQCFIEPRPLFKAPDEDSGGEYGYNNIEDRVEHLDGFRLIHFRFFNRLRLASRSFDTWFDRHCFLLFHNQYDTLRSRWVTDGDRISR